MGRPVPWLDGTVTHGAIGVRLATLEAMVVSVDGSIRTLSYDVADREARIIVYGPEQVEGLRSVLITLMRCSPPYP